MAIVYSTTLTAATSATSGILAVDTYSRLWFAFNTSATDWNGSSTVVISRLDAFGALFPLVTTQLSLGMQTLEIGEGFAYPLIFGDRIQLDLSTFEGTSVSATISIIGKP